MKAIRYLSITLLILLVVITVNVSKAQSELRPVKQEGGITCSLAEVSIGGPQRASRQPKDKSDVAQQETVDCSLLFNAPADGSPTILPAVIMTEDFEGSFPYSPWSPFDLDGAIFGEYYWDDDDFKPHTGGWSAWVADDGANGLDPQYNNYPNNMQSILLYGPFDLSRASAAELEFWAWSQTESGYDYFQWLSSNDGTNFGGLQISGDTGGWVPYTLDLSNRIGDSSVWIAFIGSSDGSITAQGTFIDDIVLSQHLLPPINDDYYSAFNISTLSYSDSQNTMSATTAVDDPVLPCVAAQKYDTVWYHFTSARSGVLTVDTMGSDYDTVLAVWTGPRGSLVNRGCNDDYGGAQSLIQLPIVDYWDYYIEVASYFTTSSNLVFTADFVPDVPSFSPPGRAGG